jgi:hypothetical protein
MRPAAAAVRQCPVVAASVLSARQGWCWQCCGCQTDLRGGLCSRSTARRLKRSTKPAPEAQNVFCQARVFRQLCACCNVTLGVLEQLR